VLAASSVLVLRAASYKYPGRDAWALRSVDLTVRAGSLTAVIGPNGAGKSTLLAVATGAVAPEEGAALCWDRPATSWPRKQLARRLAVVGQEEPPPGLPMTVRSYVELGRTPHVGRWRSLGDDDKRIVEASVETASLRELAGRPAVNLSGGERQRARLARALAQSPRALALDEPSAHLDFGHALWVFEKLAGLAAEGLAVLCVTHDLNLASRFADSVLLLSEGETAALGTAAEVLREDVLRRAYGCAVAVSDLGELGRAVVAGGGDPAAPGIVSRAPTNDV